MRSIKAMFVLLFCLMAILAVAMFKVTRQVADLRLESHQYSEQLFHFYRLSQELKQSSDHLTKFAERMLALAMSDGCVCLTKF